MECSQPLAAFVCPHRGFPIRRDRLTLTGSLGRRPKKVNYRAIVDPVVCRLRQFPFCEFAIGFSPIRGAPCGRRFSTGLLYLVFFIPLHPPASWKLSEDYG